MTPEKTAEIRRQYHREADALHETLASAMCEIYRELTGKKASDRLYDALTEAVRYERS